MKNWYIAITEENHSELLEWWNDNVSKSMSCRSPLVGEYLMSKNPKDNSFYWTQSDTDHHGLNWQQEYELITLEQFRQITNTKPMTHPEHWCIEATKENFVELNAWWEENADTDFDFQVGYTLMSQHPKDESKYYVGDIKNCIEDYPEFVEITLEQFRKITKPAQTTMSKPIQISRTLLNEYFDAATMPQQEYLTKHFKLDGTTTEEAIRGLHDLACSTWKPKIKANHPDCFPEESKYFDFSEHINKYGYDSIVSSDVAHSLGLCRDFIQVRAGSSKYSDRAFYLTGDYNWELVKEGGAMTLIPTKK